MKNNNNDNAKSKLFVNPVFQKYQSKFKLNELCKLIYDILR